MATSRWASMAEVAREELAKLEAAYPGRFGWLKTDLERLITDPGLVDEVALFLLVSPRASDDSTDTTPVASSQPAAAPPSCAVAVCTQESSTPRKRKPRGGVREREERKRTRRPSMPSGSARAKDSADMAIERAQRCLEMIREFKQSLKASWIRQDAQGVVETSSRGREHLQECGRKRSHIFLLE